MTKNYKGLEFKTSLEARWAAFFDLAGWKWWSNPMPIDEWHPDFMVTFECEHSECSDQHKLLIAVLPVSNLDAFDGHPCLSHAYTATDNAGKCFGDAGAAFGANPSITRWEMSHGAGGGRFDVLFWVNDAEKLWEKAGSLLG